MPQQTPKFQQNKPLHIALVDADPSTHAAARKSLETMAAGWTLHSHENIKRLAVLPPDVVLLSINGVSGLNTFQSLKALLPAVPSIILADKPKGGDVLMYLTLGASGYWVKTLGFEQ